MQGTMTGACRRGRPRTAWMDNIKAWTGLPVEAIVAYNASPTITAKTTVTDHCHQVISTCYTGTACFVVTASFKP